MEQSLPHTLCSESLLIATLLPTFVVRSQERRQGIFWSIATDLAAANIAIRARRRRIRGAIDDVCFIFRHAIQKRPISDIFARRFFSFDTAANGVDGLPERIFADGLFHLTELGGRRVLQLRSNRGLRRFLSELGPVADVGKQLQPTGVAARAPMRSVLMLIPHKGPEFCSQFLRRSKVALVVYHLRKSINCCLNARRSPQQTLASSCWRITVHGR